MRVAHVVRVPIAVDRGGTQPLCRQIVDQLKSAIETGVLSAGSELPSSRALAQMLQVSRTVTVTAYTELFALDYLRSVPGAGTFVADAVGISRGSARRHPVRSIRTIDFVPGQPNTERFPIAAWRSAWQRASHSTPARSQAPSLGRPLLREHVAAYLSRTRGLGCHPDQIVITSGLSHGLDLLAQLMAAKYAQAVVEDPTHPLVPAILKQRGMTITGLSVDQYGVCTDRLPDGAALAVVAPSHQFPLAGSMPLARRHAILEWASTNDTVLVELDTANELHSHDAYLPCLSSIRPDVAVVQSGTFEHLLSSDLSLGYLVLPRRLLEAAETHLTATRTYPSELVQRAAEELFASGEIARYSNLMHRIFQQKRAIVAKYLVTEPSIHLSGLAGSHVVVRLDYGVQADNIRAVLARQGIIAPTVADYFHTRTCDSNALVLGFGHLSNDDLAHGLIAIRKNIRWVLTDGGISPAQRDNALP